MNQKKAQQPQPTQQTPSPPPPKPPDDKSALIGLIHNMEAARSGTRLIVYWLTDRARISEAVVVPLCDQLSKIGKQAAIDLMLFTRGGDTEVPLRLVTLIREFCDRFSVLIPYRAHSAGTTLAMGADEIVMTPLACLSPIDPSRTHPLLPRREGAKEGEPISVQDMRHAMRFIMETARPSPDRSYTPEAMAQIVTALFEKIHPLAIGAIEQSYALAKLIGVGCLSTHMDPNTQKAQIEAIVDRLCDDYKSHSYMIDRKEARRIGLKARDASPEEESAMNALLKFYVARRQDQITKKPSPGEIFTAHIAWLDSTDLQMRVEAKHRLGKADEVTVLGDMWVEY